MVFLNHPITKVFVIYRRIESIRYNNPENSRLRGDLIEVFKIVKGFVNIDRKIFSRRYLLIVGDIVRNCKRVCLGLMFVNFHLAKELSITAMH